MIKKLSLAALALMSVAAFAQTNSNMTTTTTWSSDSMWNDKMEKVDSTLPISAKRKIVIDRARMVLSGGDGFVFTGLLDRAATSVDLALIEGLFNAHRQAILINEQALSQRFPTYVSMYSNPAMDANNTSTTTTTSSWPSDSMAMAGDDSQWRPMRWVMKSPGKPKHVDYLNAIQILTDGQDATQAGILSSWWHETASEREKDVITRILSYSAAYADRTYYPSVYTHRTWSMTTSNPSN